MEDLGVLLCLEGDKKSLRKGRAGGAAGDTAAPPNRGTTAGWDPPKHMCMRCQGEHVGMGWARGGHGVPHLHPAQGG